MCRMPKGVFPGGGEKPRNEMEHVSWWEVNADPVFGVETDAVVTGMTMVQSFLPVEVLCKRRLVNLSIVQKGENELKFVN